MKNKNSPAIYIEAVSFGASQVEAIFLRRKSGIAVVALRLPVCFILGFQLSLREVVKNKNSPAIL